MPYSDWLALITEFSFKETSFESNRVLWHSGKVFFASNFLISSWISIKTVTNSRQKRFKQLTTFFCVKLMVLIWRTLCQKGVIFVTFPQPCRTPKLDMVKISLFCRDIPVIMPKKKDNFYAYIIWITKNYNALKSYEKHAHMELIFWYWSFNKLLQGVLQGVL